jgi:arginine utilization protein RocB
VVAAETPIWGSSILWDLSGSPTPGFPVINVGPWGRDYHHWLERVHVRYAFEVLPLLVRDLCRAVLEG